MSDTPPAPRRRPSADVRELLLTAAREQFTAKGYDGATTKEIAGAAGVSEALLFTNFKTKANLYSASVIAPFTELIADYADLWARDEPALTAEARMRAFIDGLYDLADQNRTLLLSAIVRCTADGDVPEAELLDNLAGAFHSMQSSPALEHAALTYHLDMPASIAATTGMVLGVVLLDTMIFPAGKRRPSRARLTDEMTSMIVDHALCAADAPRSVRGKGGPLASRRVAGQ